MSGFRFAAALTVLVGTTSYPLAAELPAKKIGTVTLEKIEIRAAAAWAAPQTTFLKRGQQVAIYEEVGQFYAILPPPGSVSWVNHRFLGEFDPQGQGKRNAVIKKDNYAVHVGSEIEVPSEGKEASFVTDIRQVKLPYGSIVEIIGPKYVSNNTNWYPITPPAGEFRYISKAAVGNLQDVNAPTASAKPNPSGIVTGDPEAPASPANASAVSAINGAKVAHPLWGEAELLQSQGRFAEAGKVYIQIYQELKDKRAELEDLLTCLNRIDECKEKGKTPNAASGLPREAPPRSAPPATIETPTNYRPSTQPAPPPVRKDWPTSRNEERVESRSANLTGGDGKLESSGPGVLRRAPFFIDNKQAYALQTNNGELLYYVTAQPGVNLDGMISKRVELQGTVKPRGDLRGAPYMIVTKANPAK